MPNLHQPHHYISLTFFFPSKLFIQASCACTDFVFHPSINSFFFCYEVLTTVVCFKFRCYRFAIGRVWARALPLQTHGTSGHPQRVFDDVWAAGQSLPPPPLLVRLNREQPATASQVLF